MDAIVELFLYLMITGFISIVAYFVIKKAVKDAIKPFFEQRGYRVNKEQQVIRNGISLINYVMEK